MLTDLTHLWQSGTSLCRTTCVQVVQAYQAGVAALRLSLKDVTVERAENLVDQIQEVDPSLYTHEPVMSRETDLWM